MKLLAAALRRWRPKGLCRRRQRGWRSGHAAAGVSVIGKRNGGWRRHQKNNRRGGGGCVKIRKTGCEAKNWRAGGGKNIDKNNVGGSKPAWRSCRQHRTIMAWRRQRWRAQKNGTGGNNRETQARNKRIAPENIAPRSRRQQHRNALPATSAAAHRGGIMAAATALSAARHHQRAARHRGTVARIHRARRAVVTLSPCSIA